jgi:hypothetical protein
MRMCPDLSGTDPDIAGSSLACHHTFAFSDDIANFEESVFAISQNFILDKRNSVIVVQTTGVRTSNPTF